MALKRGKKLNKQSNQPISVIQRKLWEQCKRIIRKTYGNTCYTCGQKGLSGSNWHTGHMWPKQSLGASLKYDLRILRPQCYYCNINLGGNGAVFHQNMINDMGLEYVANLEKEKMLSKRGLTKAYDHYVQLLAQYEKL